MIDPIGSVAVAARIALVTVFAAAVAAKFGAAARSRFRAAVAGLVPRLRGRPAESVATAVIVTEWAVTITLLLPGIAGFVLAAATLTAFTIAIAAAVRRGATTACHCFGRSARPVSGVQLVRNLLLLMVTGIGLATTATGHHPRAISDWWIAAFAGVVLGASLIVFDDLADLIRPAPSPTRHNRTEPDHPR
ncbi:MauE/DoxX family redox-associated membrane protein [Nocardia arthritidis]|uniref:Methylamine utilization protein MauE n=1 Tax=Nocardia arthritidis TaxID=228602 RepID=A0A6G9YPX4_9NOCA|nr:MauE/DoxX family redox-associated membrane protein [Nocardia arthritidis]QIS15137.1 methylamine utilization protein MauE [Nocardia arthritidis]